MKILKQLAVTFFLLIALSISAQQGVNYKAIVKDGSGNVVTNQSITVQFSILQGSRLTNVYEETHIPTTDDNGIVILNIGEGTTSDGFANIDWGSDTHFLNTQINTGSGLVDMGTTKFMAVPYTYIAEKAKSIHGIRLESFAPNLIIGKDAGSSIGVSASKNTLLGQEAGKSITHTTSNTIIGHRSGANNSGSGNIFLGHEAGLNVEGNDKLYISNSSTSNPLILGDFANRTLTVNNNLNVAEDATINKNLIVKQTLTVDGPLTSAHQILQSTNPYLMFKYESTAQYSIKYESTSDKLIIEDIGGGNVLEIKDGELYLPDYSASSTVNLSVDSNGKLIKAPRNNQKFGVYDYYEKDTSVPTYTIARKSVAFEDNTTVKGISALLLDNNSGTGGVTNTNFVSLRRTARSSVSGSSEEIYRITGNNTASGIYNNQTSATLLISGANVIDNANYLYFLQLYYCTDCDFREVVILE